MTTHRKSPFDPTTDADPQTTVDSFDSAVASTDEFQVYRPSTWDDSSDEPVTGGYRMVNPRVVGGTVTLSVRNKGRRDRVRELNRRISGWRR